MGNSKLHLIPSNWFYNLSVYGFLKVLNKHCGIDVEDFFQEDGSVEIPLETLGELFKETEEIKDGIKSVKLWDCLIEAYLDYLQLEDFKDKPFMEKYKKIRGSLFGRKDLFRNFINPSYFKFNIEPALFLEVKNFLNWASGFSGKIKCQFCGTYPLLSEYLNQNEISNEILRKVLEGLTYLNNRQIPLLGPSEGEFPNGFWNFQFSIPLCLICNILILFYPLGLISLAKNRKVFINTPSFRLIWTLNRHIENLHSKHSYKDIKSLLDIGFIDLAIDLNIKLGTWQKLSTELVLLSPEGITFYEISPTVLELLEDKNIVSLLKELNSLELLKEFMNENFRIFEILAYRILRNPEKAGKDEFVKHYFASIYNPAHVVNLLSKLYALISQHLKTPSEVSV